MAADTAVSGLFVALYVTIVVAACALMAWLLPSWHKGWIIAVIATSALLPWLEKKGGWGCLVAVVVPLSAAAPMAWFLPNWHKAFAAVPILLAVFYSLWVSDYN